MEKALVTQPVCTYGMNSTFYDNYSLEMPQGATYSEVGVDARPEKDLLDRGAIPAINGGFVTPANLNGKRAVISNTDYIRDSVAGGKPLMAFTQPDCERAVNLMIQSKGSIYVHTSESQENNGPWANNTQGGLTSKQFRYLEEAWWGHEKAGELYNLGNYDGAVSLRPYNQDRSELRKAMQSDEGMYNYMRQRESQYHPYFSQKIYELRGPLVQGYGFGMLNPQERLGDGFLSMRFWQGVNRFLGYDPYRINWFGWGRVSEFQGYTAHTLQTIPGGTMEGHDFPIYDPGVFGALARNAAWNGTHGYQWSESLMWGRNPNLVPEEEIRSDGYKLIRINSSTAYRVPAQDGALSFQLTNPYKSNRVYPRPPVPYGQADVTPAGFYYMCQARKFYNARPLDVEFKFGGSYTPMIKDYLVDTMDYGRPWVEGVFGGNKAIIVIEDLVGKECVNGEGVLTCKLPGTGKIVDLPYFQGVTNQWHIWDI